MSGLRELQPAVDYYGSRARSARYSRPEAPRGLMRVAFCGIDGAGKSTLVGRVAAALERAGIELLIVRKRSHHCRRIVADRLSLTGAEHFLCGAPAQWYAIASALDFAASVQDVGQRAGPRTAIALFDRYTDCYLAYAATVVPPCPIPVEALLASVPRADVIIHVAVPAEVAWRRVCARPGGATDESPELLARFAQAYEDRFRARRDVHRIDATRPLPLVVPDVVELLAREIGVPPTAAEPQRTGRRLLE